MTKSGERERIIAGFRDLRALLQADDRKEDIAKKIRANTMVRERELNRVKREYAELGLDPPSELALSITARRELGYELPMPAIREDVA